jgi:beta-lactamase regulating signal transducer with metallopeptidase domain
MTALTATLNLLAGRALPLAWAMLWQSSLLILLLFIVDFILRRKLRPAIRYALWLTLLLKLLLPPTFALPTSLTWWLRPATARQPPMPSAQWDSTGAWGGTVISLGSFSPPAPSRQPPAFSTATLAFASSGTVSLALLGLMVARWLSTSRELRNALPAPGPGQQLLQELRALVRPRVSVQLRLIDRPISPAVCGLVRPVILLPKRLVESLSSAQLRSVLLHELFHISRRDVWVNCLQSLLQVVYWWHPLLWLANARIRRLREEAVDDAVVHALRDEVDHYAPALLEVAKLSLRPLVLRLGLVGILESKAALRQRIERLLTLRSPRNAGLTWPSILALCAFTAVAVPMGQGPARPPSHPPSENTDPDSWPDPRYAGYTEVALQAQFLIADTDRLRDALPALGDSRAVYDVASSEVDELQRKLQQAGAQPFTDQEIPGLQQFSGGRFHYRIGGVTNNLVNYQTRTNSNGANRVMGAEIRYVASHSDWVPLEFSVVPWFEVGSVRCQIQAAVGDDSSSVERADASMPAGGALLWTTADGTASSKAQIVLLRQTKIPKPPVDPSTEKGTSARPAMAGSGRQPPASPGNGVSNQAPEPKGGPGLISSNDGSLPSLQVGDRADTHRNLTPLASPPDLFAESNHAFGPLWKLDYKFAPGTAFYAAIGTNTEERTTVASMSNARREIYRRLSRIRFGLIMYSSETLKRVVEDLNVKAKMADPEGRGINLIINSTVGEGPASTPSAPTASSLDTVRIHIDPPLRNIRLVDLLNAIVKTADQKIKYSVEDNAVVFSPRYSEPAPLYVRTFKIDPDTFSRELRRVAASSATSRDAGKAIGLTQPTVSQLAVQYFSCLGVDFQAGPKSLLFNDREGTLIVRATLQDLDVIEAAVQALNVSAPQENIRSKSVEASQNDSGALGFDWYLDNVLMNNGSSAGERVGNSSSAVGSNPPASSAALRNLLDRLSSQGDAVVSSAGQEPEPLYTRAFSVGTNSYFPPWDKEKSRSDTNQPMADLPALLSLLTNLGVDLHPPKAIHFNFGSRMLLVRATLSDLETVGHVLSELPQTGPLSVTNKIPVLGDIPVVGRLFQQEAPIDSRPRAQPPQVLIMARLVDVKGTATALDSKLFSPPYTILADPQFRVLLKAFEQREDADVLSLMNVTTLSGRPVQLQQTEVRQVVTGMDPETRVPPNQPLTNDLDTAHLQTMSVSCGPVLDLVATVAKDRQTIDLDLTATVTEFLGYDEAKAPDPEWPHNERSTLPELPRPRVRVRKLKATASLTDGETLLVTQPTTTDFVYRQKGRPAEVPVASAKSLLLFITPTLVDPASKPVNPNSK